MKKISYYQNFLYFPNIRIPTLIETHTCWIGNISTKYDGGKLENHFEDDAKQFGKIHSTKITQNATRSLNLCYIHFFDAKGAEEAARHFNGANFDGLKLESSYRNFRDLSLDRAHPILPLPNQNNIEKTVSIKNSKFLKRQLEEKLKQFIDKVRQSQ